MLWRDVRRDRRHPAQPLTGTGTELLEVEPSPSCPLWSSPTLITVPFPSSAMDVTAVRGLAAHRDGPHAAQPPHGRRQVFSTVVRHPAGRCGFHPRPSGCRCCAARHRRRRRPRSPRRHSTPSPGSERCSRSRFRMPLPVVPFPSSPHALPPHVTTVPLPSSAMAFAPPTAIALTPLSRPTGTGASLSVCNPSPSWANVLPPHDLTVPSPSRAMLSCSPPPGSRCRSLPAPDSGSVLKPFPVAPPRAPRGRSGPTRPRRTTAEEAAAAAGWNTRIRILRTRDTSGRCRRLRRIARTRRTPATFGAMNCALNRPCDTDPLPRLRHRLPIRP